jgi:hypothetical protein
MHINNSSEMCWPVVFLMTCVINIKHWVLIAVLTDVWEGNVRVV